MKLAHALAFVALAASPAFAAQSDPTLPNEKYVLENGLEVILHQDRRVPLVAVSVWYHVGSGDETPGKSGFAHLFEHMMFQGSVHTGEDVHFELLRKAGASTVNGSTNPDRTNYFEVVPSHQLETALWLESDRMGYMLPLLNDKSFANQRDVVRNERRQNYDNVPYGKERFSVNEALYPEGHPYRYLTIGRHEDLQNAATSDVRAFFSTWYVPANATIVIGGDFDTEEAKKLVRKWFGSFPKTAKPAHRDVPTPALTGGPKKTTVEDPFAKLRRLHWAWHSPASFEAGDAELDLLASTLGNAGTGRLYKILVHEKQLAQSVSAYQASSGISSSFHVVVDLKSDADQAEVERILDEEIAKVTKEPITDRELKRAVTQYESGYVWGLEALLSRVETLQLYNHHLAKPDAVTTDLDRYRQATAAGIRDVAAAWLGKEKRIEVTTIPGGGK